MRTSKRILSAIFGAVVITQGMAISDEAHAFSGATSSATSAASISTVINSGSNNHYGKLSKCTGESIYAFETEAKNDTQRHQFPETNCINKSTKDPAMDVLYALLGLTIIISAGTLMDYSWKRMTNFGFGTKDYPNLRRVFGPVVQNYESFTPLIHKMTKRNDKHTRKP